ncbi:toxin co-regulated pilus biosynthesis Q family protein [Acidithiobacillus sulfuriphilus]|uniref:toxin co-regulated pilus biosynthesis Q family protein n=1 Tax=Acidithiobacillus sulfuriphilus TaxID=1867749 RepID=UPI003F5DD179
MYGIVFPGHHAAQTPPAYTAGPASSAAPAPAPAPAVTMPPAGPHLKGFTQALEIQPVLAVHGSGTAGLPERLHPGAHWIRSVLRDTLPTGWKVYVKSGVSLDVPVIISPQDAKKSWTAVLRSSLRDAGLHGAVWWGQKILTLWTPPVVLKPKTAIPSPDLSGYHPAKIAPGAPMAATPTAMSGAAPQAGAPSSASALPAHFHLGAPTSESAEIATPSLTGATPVFLLNQGDLILTDLQKWAKQSGWTVIWQVPEDWQVPNTTTFSGDFQKAVTQVIQALSANGANVHAVFHTANNTVVIGGAGGGE